MYNVYQNLDKMTTALNVDACGNLLSLFLQTLLYGNLDFRIDALDGILCVHLHNDNPSDHAAHAPVPILTSTTLACSR
jgi:hypothetical protein